MMNPVVHFEMPYEDRDRMAKFYEGVFGWKMQMMGEDMGGYVVATTADKDSRPDAFRGAIGGGFYPKSTSPVPNPAPSFVIGVEDVNASMKKVTDAGGTVLGEPMDIPTVGLYVAFLDTEGNRVTMLQPQM